MSKRVVIRSVLHDEPDPDLLVEFLLHALRAMEANGELPNPAGKAIDPPNGEPADEESAA